MNAHKEDQSGLSLTHERQAWQLRFLTRFSRYKNQLARRWWIVATTIGLGLGIAAMLWRLEPALYVSYGRMIVNVKLSIPEGSIYTEELNNFLGTQAALMQSALVMSRAGERLAERLPGADFQAVSLKAVIQPRTTIFLLQGTGRDCDCTQEFVQGCMEEYVTLKKEMRAQTSDTTLAGLTEEVARLEKELRNCDEELVAFQSTNIVMLMQDQGNTVGNFLAGLNQRLAGSKSEFALLETLDPEQNLERCQKGGAGDPGEATGVEVHTEPVMLADSDYLRARQQVLVLKAELEDLARYLRPKHPRMVGLSEEIARRERLLGIFQDESARQLASRKESLKLQIAGLEQEIREWNGRALAISRGAAELQRLKARAQRTQAVYDRLLATMQTLDVNKQISPESVTIMEKASPAVASQAGLGKKLFTGALAGLGAGVLVLMLLERLDDRIGSLSELQELFPQEVLGQIPREKTALRKSGPVLLSAQDERFAFVEAYRNLRSSLLYMNGVGQRPRTLLVTSSVPNDGKSLTSANLAITLASAGAKVLLVDADLRKGSLHHRFGIADPTPGLSEALSLPRRDELPRVPDPAFGCDPGKLIRDSRELLPPGAAWVHATKVPNLFLLPRGETTHRASELFLSPRAVQFLADSAAHYDFVILDTAPVMAADDVTSLAPHVDGVVFVIRAEHTSARVAHAALDLLYLRHVRVLGLVFNAVRPATADYYGYYKYKDYGEVRGERGA